MGDGFEKALSDLDNFVDACPGSAMQGLYEDAKSRLRSIYETAQRRAKRNRERLEVLEARIRELEDGAVVAGSHTTGGMK